MNRAQKVMGLIEAKKEEWVCEACGFTLQETREIMYDRMVTCPECGQAMRLKESLEEYIRKVKGKGHCVFTHQTGRNMGCYPTRSEAEKRLRQIARFRDK